MRKVSILNATLSTDVALGYKALVVALSGWQLGFPNLQGFNAYQVIDESHTGGPRWATEAFARTESPKKVGSEAGDARSQIGGN